jgi:high-affinity K+ transport system ATPase subunit B
MEPRYAARGRRSGTRTGRRPARGDVVLVEAGDTIPADGEVIEGVASVDEAPSPANRRR